MLGESFSQKIKACTLEEVSVGSLNYLLVNQPLKNPIPHSIESTILYNSNAKVFTLRIFFTPKFMPFNP
jgi:hypothetical protein